MKSLSFDQIELANSVDESAIVTNGLIYFLDASNSKSVSNIVNPSFDLSSSKVTGFPFVGNVGSPGFYQEGAKSLTFSSVNYNSSVTGTYANNMQYLKDSSLGFSGAFQNASGATIFLWANYTGPGGQAGLGTNIAVNLASGTSSVMYLSLVQNANTTGLRFVNTPNSPSSSTIVGGLNGWNSFGVSFNSSGTPVSGSATFYKNGAPLSISNNLSGLSSSCSGVNNIFIGASAAGTSPFNGHLGSLLIYNRALSSSEMLQNYNATKGKFYRSSPLDNSTLASGLYAYYSLDNLNDLVASNNLALIGDSTEITTTSGVVQNGLKFNYALHASAAGYSSNFISPSPNAWSVSLWNQNNLSGTNSTIIGANSLFVLSASGQSSSYGINLYSGNTSLICTGSAGLGYNAWYHVALVYNSGSATVYLNGNTYSTGSIVFPSLSTKLFYLNTGPSAPGGNDGTQTMDEVGIWSRALTQSDVTKLYNNGVGRAY